MTVAPPSTGSRDAHLPAIEGLRALAILLVVAYHAGIAQLSGGYVGVDVFFVLSGYLIIGLLERELRDTGTIALGEFWARRARRLLPAAAVVLLATLIAGALILPPQYQRQTATAALASATYVSNIWFAGRATDYLGDESGNPLLHTWSLSVEEQFYLGWPLMLAALELLRWGSSRTRVTWLAGILTIASFAWAVIQQPAAPSWAFFSPLTRAWEFGLGGLVAITAHDRLVTAKARSRFAVLGLVSIAAAATLFDATTAMPGIATLVPVLGTALLLMSVRHAPVGGIADPRAWLATPPMRWIGRVSYSWYLWHWPVSVLLVAWLQRDTRSVWLAGAVVSLALAEATRRWIEDPIRFHPRAAGNSRMVLAGAAAVVLLMAGVAQGARAHSEHVAAVLPHAHIAASRERPALYANGCFLAADETRFPLCVSGDTASTTRVVLLGDSHAAQWFPAIDPLAASAGWRLETFTKAACPIADVNGSGPPVEEASCAVWRARVLNDIVASKPDLVITANFAHVKWPGDRGGRYQVADWGAGYRRALVRLDAAGLRTLVLRNPPRPGFDVPGCVARLAQLKRVKPPSCAFDRELPRIVEVARQEELAARGLRHVTLVDMSDRICPDTRCFPVLDGRLVYRDRHHLTVGYAASLSDELWQRLSATEFVVELAGSAENGP